MQLSELDMRLELDAQGFVPFVGKEPDDEYPRMKKRLRLHQQKAIRELERRQRLYERLGYERQIMRTPRADGPSARQIISAVALAFGMPAEDILVRGRTRRLVDARHVLAWELRQRKNFSVIKIGELLDRDHTTVTHSLQVMHHNGHRYKNELNAVAQMLDNERSE